VTRNLHSRVLVTNVVSWEIHRLEGHRGGVVQARTAVKSGVLAVEVVVAPSVLIEIIVLVAEEVARVVHRLEGNGPRFSVDSRNDVEARVLPEQIGTIRGVDPNLVALVANKTIRVVRGGKRDSS